MLFLVGAATTKDFSAMEGDRAGGCRTLPVRYGVKKAAWMIAPFFVFPWLLVPAGERLGDGGVGLAQVPHELAALVPDAAVRLLVALQHADVVQGGVTGGAQERLPVRSHRPVQPVAGHQEGGSRGDPGHPVPPRR